MKSGNSSEAESRFLDQVDAVIRQDTTFLEKIGGLYPNAG
jgi:hypothetical protein